MYVLIETYLKKNIYEIKKTTKWSKMYICMFFLIVKSISFTLKLIVLFYHRNFICLNSM